MFALAGGGEDGSGGVMNGSGGGEDALCSKVEPLLVCSLVVLAGSWTIFVAIEYGRVEEEHQAGLVLAAMDLRRSSSGSWRQ